MVKRIVKSSAAATAGATFANGYLRLVGATKRLSLHGREHFDKALSFGRGVIIVFWHGRLPLVPFITDQTTAPVFMLASHHRDADILVNAVRGINVRFIRGSAANPKKPGKGKDGANAVAQIITALSEGGVVGITPDGPRGPRETVQLGAIKIAALSGAPILPIGAAASRAITFKSWDRMTLPTPFSKIAFVAGAPIFLNERPSDSEVETAKNNVQNVLRDVTHKAEAIAGDEAKKGAQAP